MDNLKSDLDITSFSLRIFSEIVSSYKLIQTKVNHKLYDIFLTFTMFSEIFRIFLQRGFYIFVGIKSNLLLMNEVNLNLYV
jgi:hypothetical protein